MTLHTDNATAIANDVEPGEVARKKKTRTRKAQRAQHEMISGESGAVCVAEPIESLPVVSPEQRTEQVRRVIALIEIGNSETASCAIVGINRATFRNAALRARADSDYARALSALASEQVARIDDVLERLERDDIDANAARVAIDTRKWFASKFLPKFYGDKVEHTHSGTISVVSEMSEEAIHARLVELQAQQAE